MNDFADNNFKFHENERKLSKLVENTVGKGEIAHYEQFLLFLQCFQKACFPGASKGVIEWEWVNPFPNKPWFLCVCSTSLLKTLWEKEELHVTSNFSISQCFLFFLRIFCNFHQIQSCRLQCLSVCKSLQFLSFEKGLNCLWECKTNVGWLHWGLTPL